MYRICKTIRFEAAHSLPKFPENHKCHRMHGHNYRVDIELVSNCLDERGVVMDFTTLNDVIRKRYDHHCLNDFEEFQDSPTAENMATVFVDLLDLQVLQALNRDIPAEKRVYIDRIRVWETEDCWAEWTRQDL